MRTWVSMYTRVSNKTDYGLTELMIKFNWYLLQPQNAHAHHTYMLFLVLPPVLIPQAPLHQFVTPHTYTAPSKATLLPNIRLEYFAQQK